MLTFKLMIVTNRADLPHFAMAMAGIACLHKKAQNLKVVAYSIKPFEKEYLAKANQKLITQLIL
jgi:hypothetical protein